MPIRHIRRALPVEKGVNTMYLNDVPFQLLMQERMAEIERQTKFAWMKPDRFAPRPARFRVVRRALTAMLRKLSRPLQAAGSVVVPRSSPGAEQKGGDRNAALLCQTINTPAQL